MIKLEKKMLWGILEYMMHTGHPNNRVVNLGPVWRHLTACLVAISC